MWCHWGFEKDREGCERCSCVTPWPTHAEFVTVPMTTKTKISTITTNFLTYITTNQLYKTTPKQNWDLQSSQNENITDVPKNLTTPSLGGITKSINISTNLSTDTGILTTQTMETSKTEDETLKTDSATTPMPVPTLRSKENTVTNIFFKTVCPPNHLSFDGKCIFIKNVTLPADVAERMVNVTELPPEADKELVNITKLPGIVNVTNPPETSKGTENVTELVKGSGNVTQFPDIIQGAENVTQLPEIIKGTVNVTELPGTVKLAGNVTQLPETAKSVENVTQLPETTKETLNVTELPEPVKGAANVTRLPETAKVGENVTHLPETTKGTENVTQSARRSEVTDTSLEASQIAEKVTEATVNVTQSAGITRTTLSAELPVQEGVTTHKRQEQVSTLPSEEQESVTLSKKMINERVTAEPMKNNISTITPASTKPNRTGESKPRISVSMDSNQENLGTTSSPINHTENQQKPTSVIPQEGNIDRTKEPMREQKFSVFKGEIVHNISKPELGIKENKTRVTVDTPTEKTNMSLGFETWTSRPLSTNSGTEFTTQSEETRTSLHGVERTTTARTPVAGKAPKRQSKLSVTQTVGTQRVGPQTSGAIVASNGSSEIELKTTVAVPEASGSPTVHPRMAKETRSLPKIDSSTINVRTETSGTDKIESRAPSAAPVTSGSPRVEPKTKSAALRTHGPPSFKRTTAEPKPFSNGPAEVKPTKTAPAEVEPTTTASSEEEPTIASAAKVHPTITAAAEVEPATTSAAELKRKKTAAPIQTSGPPRVEPRNTGAAQDGSEPITAASPQSSESHQVEASTTTSEQATTLSPTVKLTTTEPEQTTTVSPTLKVTTSEQDKKCPLFTCPLVCSDGYKDDENGCLLCQCKEVSFKF